MPINNTHNHQQHTSINNTHAHRQHSYPSTTHIPINNIAIKYSFVIKPRTQQRQSTAHVRFLIFSTRGPCMLCGLEINTASVVMTTSSASNPAARIVVPSAHTHVGLRKSSSPVSTHFQQLTERQGIPVSTRSMTASARPSPQAASTLPETYLYNRTRQQQGWLL